MPPHSGLVLALMALLALAGVQKVVNPAPTAGALRAAGLPGARPLVMGLGAFELLVGLTVVLLGGSLAALVASGLYASFALFVGYALWKDLPINSCGCLGATETPPSVVHVLVNTAAAATLLGAVFAPVDFVAGIPEIGTSQTAAFLIFTAGLVYLLYGALAVLPLATSRLVWAGASTRAGERGR